MRDDELILCRDASPSPWAESDHDHWHLWHRRSRTERPPQASSEIAINSLDFLPSRLAATIFEREDKGPMRNVGRRRGIRPGGLLHSTKNGRLIGYESDNEKYDLYRAEISTEVIAYREQPHTIEATINGVVRRYTPDREDQLANGRLEIVEVKDEFEAEKDPCYSAKLDYFSEVYERCGWSFRLTTREEIKNSTSFDTISNIHRFRRASYTAADIAAVHGVLDRRDDCQLGELLRLFSPEVVGFAKLCAMMVGRIIALDIYTKLEPTSIVRMV